MVELVTTFHRDARGRAATARPGSLAPRWIQPRAVMAGLSALLVFGVAGAEPRSRLFSDDEIQQLWQQRSPADADHRRYIFLDEEDIVEGTELPLYRIEGSRYGARRQLERMAQGDPGLSSRIADLRPELAIDTETDRRSEAAFYTSRPGVAGDVPRTFDVDALADVLGPVSKFVRSRF